VTPRRGSRAGERGFTLVELLVCLALLAIVGSVMGVVFTVGMRAILAPGASRDRLTAASDAISVQQLLSTDVHRATCIQFPSGGAYGSCAAEGASVPFEGDCGDSDLCFEWSDLVTANQCDVALYALSPLSRSEWLGSSESGTASYPVTVTPTYPSEPAGAWAGPGAGTWPVSVDVTVTSSNASLNNPSAVTLDLQPLATEPWPTDPLTSASTGPC
jgi:prepilin-type N-terminal cleavage/methylation domain-containing protein